LLTSWKGAGLPKSSSKPPSSPEPADHRGGEGQLELAAAQADVVARLDRDVGRDPAEVLGQLDAHLAAAEGGLELELRAPRDRQAADHAIVEGGEVRQVGLAAVRAHRETLDRTRTRLPRRSRPSPESWSRS
jgi:hypothetical protein